jgi:hypothetical protein
MYPQPRKDEPMTDPGNYPPAAPTPEPLTCDGGPWRIVGDGTIECLTTDLAATGGGFHDAVIVGLVALGFTLIVAGVIVPAALVRLNARRRR